LSDAARFQTDILRAQSKVAKLFSLSSPQTVYTQVTICTNVNSPKLSSFNPSLSSVCGLEKFAGQQNIQ